MKIKQIVLSILLTSAIGITACDRSDQELKKDAGEIAAVMCRTMEAMKNLKSVNPGDSLMVRNLQEEYRKIQGEMTVLYDHFRKKYGEKTTQKEFNLKFRKYLNESMLDCKSLSKEDREAFEKGLN